MISRSLNTTVTLAVPVPTTSKIRVFQDDEPAIKVSEGDFPCPSIVIVLVVPVPSSIFSCPADMSLRVIEAVTLMVLLLSPLLSAEAMALRRSASVETLNVLRAMRGSSPSTKRRRDR